MRYYRNKENNSLLSYSFDYTLTDDNYIEITEQEYDAIVNPPLTDEQIEQQRLNDLRAKREPLLKGYDILRINYLTGELVLTEERFSELKTWFALIKELKEDAINNVPEEIAYYL